MASSRDLRRPTCDGFQRSTRAARLELAAEADHLDGRCGSLEALLPALMPARLRACSKVSQVSTPKLWECGLLLRLSKAARYFVVDGFVMGGLAAQQTAEGDDGVHPARICNGASGGWNLHAPEHGSHQCQCVLRRCATERRARPQEPLGDHCIPAGYDDGKLHARGAEIALDGHRLALDRIGPCPEAESEARLRLDGKRRDFKGFRDRGKARNGRLAILRAQPGCGRLMHGVQSDHFHQYIGGGRKLAVHKLQITQRRQKRRTLAIFFAPAFAGRKSSAEKKLASRS